MKKMKIWLIVAAALCAVGLTVWTISLVGVGFDFEKMDTVKEIEGVHYPDEDFDTIVAMLDTADIKFLPSEDGSVKVICYEREDVRHSVSVHDGRLVIRAQNKPWYKQLFGFYFGREVITVYLPEYMMYTLTAESDTGDVTLGKSLSFASAKIETDTGDVTILSEVKGVLSLETDTGEVTLKNNSFNVIDMETDTGDVSLSSVNISGSIGILTDTGDVELDNTLVTGDINIETDTGDVSFERCDAANIYIVTDTGDVEGTLLSEKIFDVRSETGDERVPTGMVGGLCKVTTDTGDIEIRIVK
ncbi:MAG: DUF4097 family beta strand repeat protein [Clostridia bacterium]|nr:DUF4097 family beta strand repeat protein [Clostridia bacterium]